MKKKLIISIIISLFFISNTYSLSFLETSKEVIIKNNLCKYKISKYSGSIKQIKLISKKFYEIQNKKGKKEELDLFNSSNFNDKGALRLSVNNVKVNTEHHIEVINSNDLITLKIFPKNYPKNYPKEIKYVKELKFKENSYAIDYSITFTNTSEKQIIIENSLLISPGLNYQQDKQTIFFMNKEGKKRTYSYSKDKKTEIFKDNSIFLGYSAPKYYTLFIKNNFNCNNFFYNNNLIKDDKIKTIKEIGYGITLKLAPKNIEKLTGIIYAGPQDLDILKKYNAESIINMGFFGSISKILIIILRIFYKISGSWGIAIILLTIFIKLLLYPLTLKQNKSMQEMQKIQPLMTKIREKYKNDTQRMNTEIMNLYKEHNVNPLGGCFPVLIQLPILFALFTTLRVSIELKAESFLLILPKYNFWIPDLAEADKTWILPVLIAFAMHLQNKKMTDPQQKKMMAFMPFMMLFLSSSLPAGVLIYWFLSTVLGIFQQWFDSNVMGIKKPAMEIAVKKNKKKS